MIHNIFIVAAFILAFAAELCFATDRSFEDIVAFSPNNTWRITAQSPANRSSVHRPWQNDFLYSAFRNGETHPHWTRQQSTQKPYEDSPVRVTVADNGWVAIQTGSDQLIFVDPAGRSAARVDDVKKRIPENDLTTYGVGSSGGLIWSPYSLWYFLPVKVDQLFVVRLWWGRQIIINPQTGESVHEAESLQQLMNRQECEGAISLLARYTCDPISEADTSSILLGAYLAGVLQIKDVIPWLQQLEQSNFVGIEASRLGEGRKNSVDPFTFRCFTARQVSRLSLRRLGAAVSSTPAYEFKPTESESKIVGPNSQNRSNSNNFLLVQLGMTAETLMENVGSPDFVTGNCWEYDVPGDSPMTFIVEWTRRRVVRTEKVAPKWSEGRERDRQIVLFN